MIFLNLTKLEIKLEVEGRAWRACLRQAASLPYISLLGWRAPLTLRGADKLRHPLVDTISLKDEDIVRSLAKVKASNDSDI